LFPGKNGGHLHPQTLANGIVSIVHDYAGLPFNAHLVRHLVATLIMDADPANGPIAQRMLDHTDLKTTTQFYGIQRTRGAQAMYAKILEERCGKSRSKDFSTFKGPQEKKKPNGRQGRKQ
jgi:integrase